jgi:MoaA/NifB/PqqE/SkfB family radical SAM enzyme
MKILPVIEADFDCGPVGLPSRLDADLAGKSVMARVLARAAAVPGLLPPVVVCRPGDRARAAALAEGAQVLPVLNDRIPARAALRRARRWSLRSWKGGLRDAFSFDEEGEPDALLAAAHTKSAEAVFLIPSHAALLDPGLCGHLAEFCGERDAFFGFTAAPLGLTALHLGADYLEKLVAIRLPIRNLLTQVPGSGMLFQFGAPGFLNLEPRYKGLAYRVAADTRRGLDLCRRIIERGLDDAGLICDALRADWTLDIHAVPSEILLEITTDGLPANGTPQPVQRRSLSPDDVRRALAGLAPFDDVALLLGGRGDPLASPAVWEILAAAREAGVLGLAVETDGSCLTDDVCRKLIDADVDAVAVRLSAASEEVFRAVHGREGFAAARDGALRLMAAVKAAGRETPYVVIDFVKRTEVEGEIAPAYEEWLARGAHPAIRPYTDYSGRFEDKSTIRLTLAKRTMCEKLRHRMAIRADGTVPVCELDLDCEFPAGDIKKQSIAEIWRGKFLEDLRAGHARGDYSGCALCGKCRDWDYL